MARTNSLGPGGLEGRREVRPPPPLGRLPSHPAFAAPTAGARGAKGAAPAEPALCTAAGDHLLFLGPGIEAEGGADPGREGGLVPPPPLPNQPAPPGRVEARCLPWVESRSQLMEGRGC